MNRFLQYLQHLVILAVLALPLSSWSSDGSVTFDSVALSLSEDGRILLDATIVYDLNDTVAEALENGVPLTFETHVEMRRAGAWMWESDVVEHRLRTVLRYRPLSGMYELRKLGGGDGLSFATRDAALRTLGRIIGMPVTERDRLDLDQDYIVRIDSRLDREALPLPIRPLAYVKRAWSLESDAWEWQLRP